MPLTFPPPSKSLRQASLLGEQLYRHIHEIQLLAITGEGDLEEELDELHSSLNILMNTLNRELLYWQQLALTAAGQTSDIVRFGKAPDALLAGFLEGAIRVRAGEDVEVLDRDQVFIIDGWFPVHREEAK